MLHQILCQLASSKNERSSKRPEIRSLESRRTRDLQEVLKLLMEITEVTKIRGQLTQFDVSVSLTEHAP